MKVPDRVSCEITKFDVSPVPTLGTPEMDCTYAAVVAVAQSKSVQLCNSMDCSLLSFSCPSPAPQVCSSSCPLNAPSYNNAQMTSERQPQNSACISGRQFLIHFHLLCIRVSGYVSVYITYTFPRTRVWVANNSFSLASPPSLRYSFFFFLHNFMYLFVIGHAGSSVPHGQPFSRLQLGEGFSFWGHRLSGMWASVVAVPGPRAQG